MKNPTRPGMPRAKPRPKAMSSAKSTIQRNQFSLTAFAGGDPFPPQIRRLFKYGDMFALTTQAGTGFTANEKRFNLNGLFDPDYTAAGHQPYGFDQWSIAYQNYRVDKINYRVTFTPGSTSGPNVLGVLSIAPGTSASVENIDPKYLIERPNTQFGLVSCTGERKIVLTGSINLHDIFGVSKQKYESEDSYSAAVTANPSALLLMSISIGTLANTASITGSVMVELEYDAVLYSRITQSSS